MAEKQWQMLTGNEIKEKWPLHYYIFTENRSEFDKLLEKSTADLERVDTCGRTPLHFAVTFGKTYFVKSLLQKKVDANAVNKQGWNVCQEAISCGIPDMIVSLFQHRGHQRATQRLGGIPELLEDLKAAPDFYIEMKWEFTTWVPFMSKMCPNDTYKIYKRGCNVRVDTTLVGFDQNVVNWERGNMSFIFKGAGKGAEFIEVDHDKQLFTKELLSTRESHEDLRNFEITEQEINIRMSSPNISTILDTDSIAFTKHKTMWGWGCDKTEKVENYEGIVYDASGIDVVTRIRYEHLTESDKEQAKASGSSNSLQSMFTNEQEETECFQEDPEIVDPNSLNPYNLSLEEYFNLPLTKSKKDIGRPKDMVTKTQKFKATLCLCPTYPLSLQQQILPIIKLLAVSNSHFAKLRDFVALHLPSGFPVKIEIPLFHFLNARISFTNINAVLTAVNGVQNHELNLSEEESCSEDRNVTQSVCSIDEQCFDIPSNYSDTTISQQHIGPREQDDELLIQLAIQQSLSQSVDYEIPAQQNQIYSTHDDDLEKAIVESLRITSGHGNESFDEELQLALNLSKQEMNNENKDEEFERILQLSLKEK